MDISISQFEKGAELIGRVTAGTELIYSSFLSQCSNAKVYLKPENMQHTGSYKLRGAYYKISLMSEDERKRGLITASAGNHAQGVAYAAKEFGVKAIVVMPTTTPLIKVNRTKSYGAEVILQGDIYDDACSYAYKLADERNMTFVHPFNDTDIAVGQASVGVEILKELPDADVLLVPVGGGGLATGISAYAKKKNPDIKVIAVEPEGAACLKKSIEEGRLITLDQVSTIADGTAVKTIGDKLFSTLKECVDEVISVPDKDIIVAFLDMVENHKMIAENSGLLSVAALRQLDISGKKAVCVISGGNMDVITMSSVISQGLVMRDRIFTVSIHLPDKPGELLTVSEIIAANNGNIIKLEHNQFVSINRNAAVELQITIEAFGTEHKNEIIDALKKAGLNAAEVCVRL